MPLAEHRVWLAIPHELREEAKESVGKLPNGRNAISWNEEEKLWYANPGADLEKLKPWLPDNSIQVSNSDPQAEFADILKQAGLILDGLPIMDGQKHRVATVEDKKGKKSGSYTGFLDRRPAGWFVNFHRDSETVKWKASGGETDPIARLHIKAASRQSKDDVERKRTEIHTTQADRAENLYEKLPEADPNHPYLVKKGITPTQNLKQTSNGSLVVPFFNVEGKFQTLQYITKEGEKRLYKEAPKQGNFLIVGGEISQDTPVLYAEGYATARSLNLATGLPVVMTIDAGNMVTVAEKLHEKYPQHEHLFLSDFDHAKTENKGYLMATKAAEITNGRVIYPDFTSEEKQLGLTDFNDIHQSRGLDALRNVIIPALLGENEETKMQTNHQPDDIILNDNAELSQPDISNESRAESDDQSFEKIIFQDDEPSSSEVLSSQKVELQREENLHIEDIKALQAQLNAITQLEIDETTNDDLNVLEQPANSTSKKSEKKSLQSHIEDSVPQGLQPQTFETEAQEEPDAIHVGPLRPRSDSVEPEITNIDKDALLARISWEKQGENAVLYKLDEEPAFIDHGSRLVMTIGASGSDEKVIAALLTASQYYRGRIELTGSASFKEKALTLIARHNINVSMKVPSQQAMLETIKRNMLVEQAPQDAIRGDVLPSALHHIEHASNPVYQKEDKKLEAVYKEPKISRITQEKEVKKKATSSPQDQSVSEANIPPSVHQNYNAAKDGITGKIMECGEAHFRFDEKNEKSVFIKLRTKKNVETFWGKELAGLLRETRLQPGRVVTLTWLGKQDIKVKVPKRDANKKIIGYEEKQVHRNKWSLTPVRKNTVRNGSDEGVKLSAYDAGRFAQIQKNLIRDLGITAPPIPEPNDGLFWLKPDGQGSISSGDALSAKRPEPNRDSGTPVVSSWSKDGELDMYLVRSDGNYLQGIVRHQNEYQHVLVSLPNNKEAPPMVFNMLSNSGATAIGMGNGINRAEGKPVTRENIAFKLDGETSSRIGKLEEPSSLPRQIHAHLGFDEAWSEISSSPKPSMAASKKTRVEHRPVQ